MLRGFLSDAIFLNFVYDRRLRRSASTVSTIKEMENDIPRDLLSPSIHKFDDVFIYSGLSAALGHEPFGLELMAERLGPNGVSPSV